MEGKEKQTTKETTNPVRGQAVGVWGNKKCLGDGPRAQGVWVSPNTTAKNDSLDK